MKEVFYGENLRINFRLKERRTYVVYVHTCSISHSNWITAFRVGFVHQVIKIRSKMISSPWITVPFRIKGCACRATMAAMKYYCDLKVERTDTLDQTILTIQSNMTKFLTHLTLRSMRSNLLFLLDDLNHVL